MRIERENETQTTVEKEAKKEDREKDRDIEIRERELQGKQGEREGGKDMRVRRVCLGLAQTTQEESLRRQKCAALFCFSYLCPRRNERHEREKRKQKRKRWEKASAEKRETEERETDKEKEFAPLSNRNGDNGS